METDLNYWGIISVPIGIILCFGAALIFWLKAELSPPPQEHEDRREKS